MGKSKREHNAYLFGMLMGFNAGAIPLEDGLTQVNVAILDELEKAATNAKAMDNIDKETLEQLKEQTLETCQKLASKLAYYEAVKVAKKYDS